MAELVWCSAHFCLAAGLSTILLKQLYEVGPWSHASCWGYAHVHKSIHAMQPRSRIQIELPRWPSSRSSTCISETIPVFIAVRTSLLQNQRTMMVESPRILCAPIMRIETCVCLIFHVFNEFRKCIFHVHLFDLSFVRLRFVQVVRFQGILGSA